MIRIQSTSGKYIAWIRCAKHMYLELDIFMIRIQSYNETSNMDQTINYQWQEKESQQDNTIPKHNRITNEQMTQTHR